MSIAKELAKRGISKFTPEDFTFVTSQLSKDPDRLILVGGQAVEVWAVLFDVPSPSGQGVALTEDADWLGGKLDAKWLCDLLQREASVELTYANDFDATPSSAIAYIQRGQRILLMDFLRSIVGPTTEEIRKLAVRVKLQGHEIHVLHPILCLHSRLANLQVLQSKRTPNGIAQARWMLDILKAYFFHMVEQGEPKDNLAAACRKIGKFAEFEPGKYCYLEYSIDALGAIPEIAIEYVGGKFQEIEWKKIVERISKKREKWVEQRSRTVQHCKQIGS